MELSHSEVYMMDAWCMISSFYHTPAKCNYNMHSAILLLQIGAGFISYILSHRYSIAHNVGSPSTGYATMILPSYIYCLHNFYGLCSVGLWSRLYRKTKNDTSVQKDVHVIANYAKG